MEMRFSSLSLFFTQIDNMSKWWRDEITFKTNELKHKI